MVIFHSYVNVYQRVCLLVNKKPMNTSSIYHQKHIEIGVIMFTNLAIENGGTTLYIQ